MRKSRRPIVIAARRSRLARVQAEAVGRKLSRLHPQIKVEFRWLQSEGDQHQDQPLADAGGKGLFARSVEQALLSEKADLAVHSLKDLPLKGTLGLGIAAVPRRGDVRDCLVAAAATTIDELPREATVGTASPRRAAQLLRLRSDLQIQLLRGNVQTRLKKVIEDHEFDATLMAVAGLQRAGLGDWAQHPIDPRVILPAASQGALALQCRADDHVTLTRCLPLNDPTTAAAVNLERTLLKYLGGDCHCAIGVLAELNDGDVRTFRMRAIVLAPDGASAVTAERVGSGKARDKLAKQVAEDLLQQGADLLLRAPAEQPLRVS